MINLEVPKKFSFIVEQAHQVAVNVFRPISRQYDREEHTYPHELDMLAAALQGAAFGLLPIGWIVLSAIFLCTWASTLRSDTPRRIMR